jgi:hypothetical protein
MVVGQAPAGTSADGRGSRFLTATQAATTTSYRRRLGAAFHQDGVGLALQRGELLGDR